MPDNDTPNPSRFRLRAFAVLAGLATVSAAAVRAVGGVEAAPAWLLVILALVAGCVALLVVLDTFSEAFHGTGQACRHCGHRRHLASFQLSGSCPQCGQ